MRYKPDDYKNNILPLWCKGCTFYSVFQAITAVFADKQIPPHQMNIISGIGCSSRMSLYFSTFGMHTLHGRSIPVAVGARLARPDIPVMVIGGDGDLFSIGMGHFVHAAQKNINITVLCLDNKMYAMTKNQVSPTAVQGQYGTLSPHGKLNGPIDSIGCAMSSGATLVARTSAYERNHLQHIITRAFDHKGFSFVEILAPCRTYGNVDGNDNKQCLLDVNIELGHDPTNKSKAVALIGETGSGDSVPVGVFYESCMPTYEELLNNNRSIQKDIGEIIDTIKKQHSKGESLP